MTGSVGEILDGVWRLEAVHPEWTEEEGGEDGWDPVVAWWAVRVPAGLVLIDPLVEDWSALDRLVEEQGGCPGIVRTCHWHQRSIAEASGRYGAEVWAGPPHRERAVPAFDHELSDGKSRLTGSSCSTWPALMRSRCGCSHRGR